MYHLEEKRLTRFQNRKTQPEHKMRVTKAAHQNIRKNHLKQLLAATQQIQNQLITKKRVALLTEKKQTINYQNNGRENCRSKIIRPAAKCLLNEIINQRTLDRQAH